MNLGDDSNELDVPSAEPVHEQEPVPATQASPVAYPSPLEAQPLPQPGAPATPERKSNPTPPKEEEKLDGFLAWSLGFTPPPTVVPEWLEEDLPFSPSVMRTQYYSPTAMNKTQDAEQDFGPTLSGIEAKLKALELLA